jgi:hypothetical protein
MQMRLPVPENAYRSHDEPLLNSKEPDLSAQEPHRGSATCCALPNSYSSHLLSSHALLKPHLY